MLQIAIIEDEADLAQQTKVNAVRYLNEHGLEGNIAVFNDGMDMIAAWTMYRKRSTLAICSAEINSYRPCVPPHGCAAQVCYLSVVSSRQRESSLG